MEELYHNVPMKEIFCRYIHRNGKIIYPKNGRLFHFWVPADECYTEQQALLDKAQH